MSQGVDLETGFRKKWEKNVIVSELIKKLETLENKEQIVYVVSNKQDSREQSFNHRSTRLQNIETFSGFEMGYEHMSGVFLQGEGGNK